MFSLDVRSREPIYLQLEKEIVKYINLGIFEADSPLPSVRALATELSINPNTVSKAYKNLELRGVIYTVAGKGVFINKTDLSDIHKEAKKFLSAALSDARNAGLKKADVIEIVNTVWEAEV